MVARSVRLTHTGRFDASVEKEPMKPKGKKMTNLLGSCVKKEKNRSLKNVSSLSLLFEVFNMAIVLTHEVLAEYTWLAW